VLEPFRLTINGAPHELGEAPDVSLLEVLRDRLGLTGAKYGCGEAQCGACVVLLDGQPVPACITAIASAAGREVTTVEGLTVDGELHPVQQAFVEADALQCGYCTPGMVVAAAALLRATPHPTHTQIVAAMQSHVCRCGAYARIVKAIDLAAERMAQ
jgi:aerobic-type carbon monoxide dehydrogenase small subunit (CoxS/CutS family)